MFFWLLKNTATELRFYRDGTCAMTTMRTAGFLGLAIALSVFGPQLLARPSASPSSIHYYGGWAAYQTLDVTADPSVSWTAVTIDYSWLTVPVTQEAFVANTPPTVTVLSTMDPSATSQTVSIKYDDPNGPGDLQAVYAGLGVAYGYDGACELYFDTGYGQLYLAQEGGGLALVPVGQPGILYASTCQIDAGASQIQYDGSSLILRLALSIRQSEIGTMHLFARTNNNAYQFSGSASSPIPGQDWTAHPEQNVAPAVTISSNNQQIQAVGITISDPNGYKYISSTGAQTWLSLKSAAGSTCHVVTNPVNGQVAFYGWINGSYVLAGLGYLGSGGVVSSDDCAVDLSGSSRGPNPSPPGGDPNAASSYPGIYTTEVWNLRWTVKPSVTAPQYFYARATDVLLRAVEVAGPTFTPTAANPVPMIGSLVPASATAGSGDLTVTLNGSGFIPSSQVQWNGSNRTASYVSAAQMILVVPASDLQSVGTESVTVTNSAPGGGTGAAWFVVTAPPMPPAITAAVLPIPNAAGWNNSNVTVSFYCQAGSYPVASCPSPATVSTETAGQVVTGAVTDTGGGRASTGVTVMLDKTLPAVTIASPANGTSLSSLAITVAGTVIDPSGSGLASGVAAVSCNGAPATVTGSAYTCGVTLNQGSNVLTVLAADNAGNGTTASATYPVALSPAPSAVSITPDNFAIVLRDTLKISLVDNLSRVIPADSWTVSDPTIAQIGVDGTLAPVGAGTATVTGSYQGLSATAQVTIYDAPTLPVGTIRWSVQPLPGKRLVGMVPGRPATSEDSDVYFLESDANSVTSVRALTSDGRQKWVHTIANGTDVALLRVPVGARRERRGLAPGRATGPGMPDMTSLQNPEQMGQERRRALSTGGQFFQWNDAAVSDNGNLVVRTISSEGSWVEVLDPNGNLLWSKAAAPSVSAPPPPSGNATFTSMALHPSGVIYVLQSDHTDDINSLYNHSLLALDESTGTTLFSAAVAVSLTPGYVYPYFGKPSVLSDGNLYYPFAKLSEDYSTETLSVLRVGLDGTSTVLPVATLPSCKFPPGSNPPWHGDYSGYHLFLPREVLPDNAGGFTVSFGAAAWPPDSSGNCVWPQPPFQGMLAHFSSAGTLLHQTELPVMPAFGSVLGENLLFLVGGTGYGQDDNIQLLGYNLQTDAVDMDLSCSCLEIVSAADGDQVVMRTDDGLATVVTGSGATEIVPWGVYVSDVFSYDSNGPSGQGFTTVASGVNTLSLSGRGTLSTGLPSPSGAAVALNAIVNSLFLWIAPGQGGTRASGKPSILTVFPFDYCMPRSQSQADKIECGPVGGFAYVERSAGKSRPGGALANEESLLGDAALAKAFLSAVSQPKYAAIGFVGHSKTIITQENPTREITTGLAFAKNPGDLNNTAVVLDPGADPGDPDLQAAATGYLSGYEPLMVIRTTAKIAFAGACNPSPQFLRLWGFDSTGARIGDGGVQALIVADTVYDPLHFSEVSLLPAQAAWVVIDLTLLQGTDENPGAKSVAAAVAAANAEMVRRAGMATGSAKAQWNIRWKFYGDRNVKIH